MFLKKKKKEEEDFLYQILTLVGNHSRYGSVVLGQG